MLRPLHPESNSCLHFCERTSPVTQPLASQSAGFSIWMTRYTGLHSVLYQRQGLCSTRFCRHSKPTMGKRASLCTTKRKVCVSLLQVNKAYWSYAPARCLTPQNRTSGRSFRPLRRRLPPVCADGPGDTMRIEYKQRQSFLPDYFSRNFTVLVSKSITEKATI